MKNKKELTKVVYWSRIGFITLQYICNQLLPDHQADAFRYPAPKDKTTFDDFIDHTLGGFLRWDAQYFMHIARYGYTYEQTLAFFPLYPITVGYMGQFISSIVGDAYLDSILLILFITFNVYVFKLAADYLYELTNLLFNETIAFHSVLIYCFNPATIFFLAPYTETIFSCLSFYSMYQVVKLYKNYDTLIKTNWFYPKMILSAFTIGLTGLTRSNGLLNTGFYLYCSLCLLKSYNPPRKIRFCLFVFVTTILCVLPFVLFQLFSYKRFCEHTSFEFPSQVLEYGKSNSFVLPLAYQERNITWCLSYAQLPYSYVQDYYWNVGFFKYYTLKQLPNFLIALPILVVVTYSCFEHFYCNLVRRKLFNIFLMENPKESRSSKCDIYQPQLTLFYGHALFLAVFCIFFVHIQVSTRLLCSASPIFYWICGIKINISKRRECTADGHFMVVYCILYVCIGIIMFSNFLPWT
ncbi:hypothetical protein ABEB36_000857 [Hypothenemus hampei]|uniref:GPI mannosyltransferase 2 n=1 Tax=Hypothenemus hampei TaxID=57062 RepID=A0ABD1FDG0_HYPHA